jgi:integrase
MKGNLTRRGERSWRLKYDIGSDAAGDRQIRYVTLRGTKAEAQKAAAKILASVATGTHVDPSSETVRDFAERWLRDWADANVSNKTWTRYSQLLRKHLCSRAGSLPIQKLKPADLQAVYAAMARDGLAPLTRLHMHRVASTMLKHAMQWGVVARNVAGMVDAPRAKAKEIEILSPVQVGTVLDALRGKPPYPIVAVALGTGLRRSELLALRWRDVDLDGGTLRVEQALEQTQRGGLVFRPPKTQHGRRTVTLAPSTVAVLREHWRVQQERRLFFGLGKAGADALVFCSWDGSPYLPSTLTLQWRRAMQAAGLNATLHSLRHTHASTLIAAGLDVLTISRRLGHGSPAITLGVYGHLFRPDDRAAAIWAALLRRPPQSYTRRRRPRSACAPRPSRDAA